MQFCFFYNIFPLKFNTIESTSSSVDINSRGLIYKKKKRSELYSNLVPRKFRCVLKLETDNFSDSTLIAFPCCFTVGTAVEKMALATWLLLAARLLSKGQKPQQESQFHQKLWSQRDEKAEKNTRFIRRHTSWLTRHSADSLVMGNIAERKQTLTQHQSALHWVCSVLVLPQFLSLLLCLLHQRCSLSIALKSFHSYFSCFTVNWGQWLWTVLPLPVWVAQW